jgi:hypothetical protein
MKLAPTLTALLSVAASMANAAPEARPPSDAELASFSAYYQQQFPANPPAKPVFSITRENPKSAWTIGAAVDAPARRGLHALCRMTRTDFRYAGRWSAAGQPRPYAWLERRGCAATAQAVEMLQQMPDTEVIGLLERQGQLLQSARILLGGNTACASQRSFRFALAKIDVGTAGPSTEVLAGLVYKSDHDTLATVWVRRNGADYTAWNVSCP